MAKQARPLPIGAQWNKRAKIQPTPKVPGFSGSAQFKAASKGMRSRTLNGMQSKFRRAR